MESREYLERLYGGLVGKCVGVRLGAPVEPTIWSYERIRETYGEITDYVKNYRNFAADDDINGPLFFVRALVDHEGLLTSQAVARAWLNYTREGIGFFWWGGYGRSTEHTAYLNLQNGIPAPESGSIKVNGASVAEQIGGQIFIDSWGWVFPEDAGKAAHHAGLAAAVSHDGNGIYGGQFIAACVSLAFSLNDVGEIVEQALKTIPADSEYTRVVSAVRNFHRTCPDDWRAARDMLAADFGYDRYPGVCHIIPNAGVCALALYYGKGDFARTVEIATMCGWDTDCNAGNVGAILGTMAGPEGIPQRYRRPINDWHAAASISGALNNIDLPTAARELATLGYRQMAQKIPAEWAAGTFSDDVVLDFSLPGSTCGMRTSSGFLAPMAPAGNGAGGKRGATFILDRLVRGDTAYLFNKPYYTREDFDDERYRPSFTPLAYSGQTLRISGVVERQSGGRLAIAAYSRDARTGEAVQDGFVFPEIGKPFNLEWTLPETPFAIAETGIAVMNPDPAKFLGDITITSLTITGPREFSFRFEDERNEFDGLSRCAAFGGAWALENGGLHVLTPDRFLLFGGPYYSVDSDVETELVPENGESHLLAFRARGTEYGYFFGLQGAGRVALLRRDHDDTILAEVDFNWDFGNYYRLSAEVRSSDEGCRIRCLVNGIPLLETIDPNPQPYGMAGVGKTKAGRTRFLSLSAKELPVQ